MPDPMRYISYLFSILGIGTTAPVNATPVNDADILDFSDAPGGDIPLSDLFGDQPEAVVAPTTAPSPDTTSAPVTNQPAPADFYLDAGTSKYKTREEAIKGFAHKDEVIEHLRGIAVQATGIDPLTGQKVAVPRSPSSAPYAPGQPVVEDSYLNNPAKYSADLRDAVAKNDENRYLQIQTKLAREQMMTDFAPFAPMLQKFAVAQAVDSVASTKPEFKGFYGSPEYQKALETRPLLKGAIQNAESNMEFQSQLPELYSLAYEISQLQKMSDLLKTQQPPSTPTQTRPTTTPSKLAPPSQSVNTGNWRTNHDAAKTLVEEYERKNGF
jgi:hypothetical protein